MDTEDTGAFTTYEGRCVMDTEDTEDTGAFTTYDDDYSTGYAEGYDAGTADANTGGETPLSVMIDKAITREQEALRETTSYHEGVIVGLRIARTLASPAAGKGE